MRTLLEGRREPPFRRATFLNDTADPRENPWWLLFGYDTRLGRWMGNPSEYTIHAIGGNLELAARADRLMTSMQGVNPRGWQQSNLLRWYGLEAFVAAIRQQVIPCLPMIS